MYVTTDYNTGYSAGAPSEFQTFLRRNDYKGDGTKTPILFFHGFGGKASDVFAGTNNAAVPAILRHLARCGWPVLAADAGGDTWGNATGITRVGEAKTYLQGTLGAKSGPVVLMGYSHGGLLAMAYARANPANVKALVPINPAINLLDAVTNNRDGAAASINAAAGGTYSDVTNGPTMSPYVFASQLAGMPTFCAHASDDTLALPQWTASVLAAIGSVTERTGTGGHGETFMLTIDPYDVSSWLSAQGA